MNWFLKTADFLQELVAKRPAILVVMLIVLFVACIGIFAGFKVAALSLAIVIGIILLGFIVRALNSNH